MGLSNPVDAGNHSVIKRRKRLMLVGLLTLALVAAVVVLPRMF
jgi:predicted nucleic acid-binding Zn ribbon protein